MCVNALDFLKYSPYPGNRLLQIAIKFIKNSLPYQVHGKDVIKSQLSKKSSH